MPVSTLGMNGLETGRKSILILSRIDYGSTEFRTYRAFSRYTSSLYVFPVMTVQVFRHWLLGGWLKAFKKYYFLEQHASLSGGWTDVKQHAVGFS